MANKYDDTPEVAPQNLPEVVYQHPYEAPKESQSPVPGFTPVDGSTVYSNLSPYQQFSQPVETAPPPQKEKTVCGFPLIVFILGCIIALLSAGVIGLAAGTGVEANRANDYSNRLAALSSSLATQTTTSAAPTSTSYNSLTNGCSDDASTANRKNYTAFPLYGSSKFTMFCNRDTDKPPLLGLFVSNFNTCMDACASWTKYLPDDMTSTASNLTCGAVSFIPLWTDKTHAKDGGAPGNCYLKAAPFNESSLLVRDIGTEVHSAIGFYVT